MVLTMRLRKLDHLRRGIRIIQKRQGDKEVFIIRSYQSLPGLYNLETNLFESLDDAKSSLLDFRKTLKGGCPKLRQKTRYEVSWLPPDTKVWQHRHFFRIKAVRKFVKFIHLNDLSMEPVDVEMVRCYRANANGDLVKLGQC
jgi:hypothetical protein